MLQCFQARILCSEKCKCTGCLNQAGSQRLIDKRRKMKDAVGTRLAIEESEKKWKSQGPRPLRLIASNMSALPSPASQARPAIPHLHGNPYQSGFTHYPHQYTGQGIPYPYHPSHMYIPYGTPNAHGFRTPYSTLEASAATAISRRYHPQSTASALESSIVSSPLATHHPESVKSKRTTTVVSDADVSNLSAKRTKSGPPSLCLGHAHAFWNDETFLAVLAFLSNDDLRRTSLVCKAWNEAMKGLAI